MHHVYISNKYIFYAFIELNAAKVERTVQPQRSTKSIFHLCIQLHVSLQFYVFYTVTKSMRTIHKNMVIHTATHTTPEDLLICGDSLINDKAKICNHHKFYNHYYESFIKSSWSGSISCCLFPFLFTNPNNLEPLQIQNLQLCIKFFFTSVTDQTNCLAIKGFDRTKPIFDRTLSVDRLLFQALILAYGLKPTL